MKFEGGPRRGNTFRKVPSEKKYIENKKSTTKKKSIEKKSVRPKFKVSKNNGDYIRLVTRNDQGEQKTKATWQIVGNDGDGDCLFLTIMQFLTHYNIERPKSIKQLRKAIVQHVINNWPEFVFGITNLPPQIRKKMSKHGCMYLQEIENCVQIYGTYMRTSGVYGTEIELKAACELYKFQCTCLQEKSSSRYLAVPYYCTDYTHTAFIYFTGDMTMGHFEFMEPVNVSMPNFLLEGRYKLIGSKVDAKSVINFIMQGK